jgi:hypothetical protein
MSLPDSALDKGDIQSRFYHSFNLQYTFPIQILSRLLTML